MAKLTFKEMVQALQQEQLKALESNITVVIDICIKYVSCSVINIVDENNFCCMRMLINNSICEETNEENFSFIMKTIREKVLSHKAKLIREPVKEE